MSRPHKHGRDVHGILLLDKPKGWTSNHALQAVKRLYRARKAGHGGTLDPLATGLLPIFLGEATKVSAFLLEGDKRYLASCRLGIKTATGDADGEVIGRQPVEDISGTRLEAALAALRGEIEQVPPMASALKHQGRRLYELARAGIEVERAPRRIRVERLDVLRRDGDVVELDIRCSKGAYVRSLVEALGESLGCGAHLAGLRRTGAGPFGASRMIALDDLTRQAEQGPEAFGALDAALLPVDAALAHWPAVTLNAEEARRLRQGQAVRASDAPAADGLRLYGPDARFLGLGRVRKDGRVAPKRLLAGAAVYT